MHLFVAGLPEPTADSVLAVGIDLQATVSLVHRGLDLLF
jgi:hypothetical protein